MINFNGKKYELLFSNNLLPFWALHYSDFLFFNEFKKQCGAKYNIVSIIENNWQKKYAELHSLDELTNAFTKKVKNRKWLNELKTTYREKTIKVEKLFKIEINKTTSDKELIAILIHLRSESVPLDAMSNMLHIFAHLAQDEKKLNDAEDILKYGIFVKDNVSKLLLRRKNFINKIFKEIAKRFGINIKDLEFLSLQEINILIKSGKINKQLIQNRRNFTVVFFNGKSKILEGKSGHNFVNKGKFKDIIEAGRGSIKGFGASSGKVRGKCVVVENIFMAKAKMKKGSILIVPYTGPEYLPIFKLAKAVVTDTGGITSHAAIVSRELKIPCVIGTKIATKIFKDGDLVEVDANTGIVKIIK